MAVRGRCIGVLAATSVPAVLLASCGGGTTAPPPAPENLSNTISVHVSVNGRPDPTQALRLTRLGPKGEAVSSIETSEHDVHVSRGTFEIALAGTPPPKGPGVAKKVTVGENQDLTISLSSVTQARRPGGRPPGRKHSRRAH